MEDQGLPLFIGVIAAAAVLGAIIVGGMVVMAAFSVIK